MLKVTQRAVSDQNLIKIVKSVFNKKIKTDLMGVFLYNKGIDFQKSFACIFNGPVDMVLVNFVEIDQLVM